MIGFLWCVWLCNIRLFKQIHVSFLNLVSRYCQKLTCKDEKIFEFKLVLPVYRVVIMQPFFIPYFNWSVNVKIKTAFIMHNQLSRNICHCSSSINRVFVNRLANDIVVAWQILNTSNFETLLFKPLYCLWNLFQICTPKIVFPRLSRSV